MPGQSLHPDADNPTRITRHLPTPGPVAERILRWAVLLAYAGTIGLVALFAGIVAVYAGAILPTSFGTVLLRWGAAVVFIAAAPNIAHWLLSRLIGLAEADPGR